MNDLSRNTMIEFTQRYARKPTLFVREVLGVEPLVDHGVLLEGIASGVG